jgi:hypothetical protein
MLKSAFIFVIISIGFMFCHRNTVTTQKQDSSKIEKIEEALEASIICRNGNDDKSMIYIVDKNVKEETKGYVELVITFSNLDSLVIQSIHLNSIYYRFGSKIKSINSKNSTERDDSMFNNYQKIILPKLKDFKCWYERSDNIKLTSCRQIYNIPIIISPKK